MPPKVVEKNEGCLLVSAFVDASLIEREAARLWREYLDARETGDFELALRVAFKIEENEKLGFVRSEGVTPFGNIDDAGQPVAADGNLHCWRPE